MGKKPSALEEMERFSGERKMNDFWKGKKVFVTGHTGFKGSWLCMWLHLLGAKVAGYSLSVPTKPSLFELCKVEELMERSIFGDIRDLATLKAAMIAFQPEVVVHMAAQPLVRESYSNPAETYAINVMGTVNVMEAIRETASVRAVVNVTTDKCYENKEWVWGYRENEPLGGYDPYSSSKACSELVTAAYRQSYFNSADYDRHRVAVATARAGNVIGGGDWARDRLIPDCIHALLKGQSIQIRNPNSIRPWQHVLEPLSGYLTLARKLYEAGSQYGEAWNFGPEDSDARSVEWVVKKLCEKWGNNRGHTVEGGMHPHEASYLKLDCSQAKIRLNWAPIWNLDRALSKITEWGRAYQNHSDLRWVSLQQIKQYQRERGIM